MRSLKAILREIFGLFVDDGRFALAIIVWLLVAWLALPRLELFRKWSGAILFVGLVAILVESALRRARR